MSQVKTSGVPFIERVAFGCGDASCNIFMSVTMMFLSIFYTDVFKVSPAFVGTLFMLTRFFDAFFDPFIGSLTDRFKFKQGRCRPWMIYAAIPYGLSIVALFWAPDLSPVGKEIYAAITYIFLVLIYSCISVPYVSLIGAITSDSAERVQINALRFPISKVAYFVVSLGVPAVLAYFSSAEVGYRVAMIGIGFLTVIFALFCAYTCQERVTQHEEEMGITKKVLPVKTQLKSVFKNEQALLLCGVQALMMCTITFKMSTVAYYVKYYLNSGNTMLSIMFMVLTVAGILGPIFTGYFIKNNIMNCRKVLIVSQVGSCLFAIAMIFAGHNDAIFALITIFISTCFAELIGPIVWAGTADCADYGFYKDGVRATGMISGTMMFSTKLGMAVAGGAMGFILEYYGYDGSGHVTADQMPAFPLLIAILPAIVFALNAILAYKYKLTDKYMKELHESKGKIINKNKMMKFAKSELI